MSSTGRLRTVASRITLRVVPCSSFVCPQCRLHAIAPIPRGSSLSASVLQSRAYASFTDRVRKKIWGSENPPGLEDPYGSQSVLDQRNREQELEDERKGAKTQVAPSPEDPEEEHKLSDYVAKTTWDGMETVGYEGWGREEWDKKHPFEGYLNPKKADRREIIAAIHRALVEIYTLKQEGLPLSMDYFAFDLDNDYARQLAEGSKFELNAVEGTKVVVEDEELRQQILKSVKPKGDTLSLRKSRKQRRMQDTIPQEELQAAANTDEGQGISNDPEYMFEQESAASLSGHDGVDTESFAEDEHSEDVREAASYHILGGEYEIKPADDSWRNISLDDPQIKFAVIKRVMQLTGVRIPDPDISSITSTKALLGHLVRKPKAKRLAESLFANEVAELPNVQIVDRRYTPIDKEKEVGRWKVIEKELTARGLPITGNEAGPDAMTVAT